GEELTGRQVTGPAALVLRRQSVAEADIGEGAARHHLVVPASRAVAVELARADAMLDQVAAGRAVRLNGARGRNVIRGLRVAQHGQGAGATNVGDRGWLGPEVDEERGLLDIGRRRVPRVQRTGRGRQPLPAGVAVEHAGIARAKELGPERGVERFADLAFRWP